MGYVFWSLLGMAGYSATTTFAKLATRDGGLTGFQVLAFAVPIVLVSVWSITAMQSGANVAAWPGLNGRRLVYALAGGIALAIAVTSLFRALALGPASVVVPIYGMFILGGSALGILFLGEPPTLRKVIGMALAVAGVVLIAR